MKLIYLSNFFVFFIVLITAQVTQAATLTVSPNPIKIQPGETRQGNLSIDQGMNESINCNPCTTSVSISAPLTGQGSSFDFGLDGGITFIGPFDVDNAFSIFAPNTVKAGQTFSGTVSFSYNPTISSQFTVEVVPEPLTILGAGTAIVFGASFKRKLVKAKKK